MRSQAIVILSNAGLGKDNMGLLFTFIIILIVGFRCWAALKKHSAKERKKLAIKSTIYVLITIIILLAISGRISWIVAAGAALIPIVKIIFIFIWKSLPLIQVWMRTRGARGNRTSSVDTNNKITKSEAWEILDLEPGSADEKIIQKHRELMQKLHPDRGGSNYMASKLNLARDVLLAKK